jgi:hypothetical protein
VHQGGAQTRLVSRRTSNPSYHTSDGSENYEMIISLSSALAS